MNGTLPADGTKCEPDVPLFADITNQEWLDSIKGNLTKRDVDDDDDRVLMDAMLRLSKRVPRGLF